MVSMFLWLTECKISEIEGNSRREALSLSSPAPARGRSGAFDEGFSVNILDEERWHSSKNDARAFRQVHVLSESQIMQGITAFMNVNLVLDRIECEP